MEQIFISNEPYTEGMITIPNAILNPDIFPKASVLFFELLDQCIYGVETVTAKQLRKSTRISRKDLPIALHELKTKGFILITQPETNHYFKINIDMDED